MAEQIYTIPFTDALMADDECPICWLRRKSEQDLLDFVLGSGASYMESDMRAKTDEAGFCKEHFRKMFVYGNSLGNAWILKTHYMQIESEMDKAFSKYKPGKVKHDRKTGESTNPIVAWAKGRGGRCYLCEREKAHHDQCMQTFCHLWHNDPEFKERAKSCKGFCVSHFGDLCDAVDTKLSAKEAEEFYNAFIPKMKENVHRVFEDVSWFVEKFRYENKDADWKSSKDAVQRGMQKLKGGYPADSDYKHS